MVPEDTAGDGCKIVSAIRLLKVLKLKILIAATDEFSLWILQRSLQRRACGGFGIRIDLRLAAAFAADAGELLCVAEHHAALEAHRLRRERRLVIRTELRPANGEHAAGASDFR